MTDYKTYKELRDKCCNNCKIGFDRCAITSPQKCPLIDIKAKEAKE